MIARRTFIVGSTLLVAYTARSQSHASVLGFGFKGDGTTDDSAAIQSAIDACATNGGGTVHVPKGLCLCEWPIFVPSNVNVVHHSTVILITHGVNGRPLAPAYVIGDCREFSRRIVDHRRKTNDMTHSYEDPEFRDIPLGLWPEEQDARHGINGIDDARIRATNSSVSGMHIQPSGPLTDRAYGVFFANASRCAANDWSSDGLTQPFSMGSDVPPRTPYALDCTVSNLKVYSPSQFNTYYGMGFLGNANRCKVTSVVQLAGVPDNIRNGNMLYANFVKNCVFQNFNGICGRGRNGDGVGLQNASGCLVTDGIIYNAKQGVSEFYRDERYLSKTNPNHFKNILSVDCDTMLRVGSRYSIFENIKGHNCKCDIKFNSISAVDNEFINCDYKLIDTPPMVSKIYMISNNKGLQ